ncbi:unnamed protein product [Cuscuta europaea]|uniref:EamA domain-containing protein n=1 Tax=Cuscuta europaea TaxID=41803 RepID=A0A9P0Z4W0_CUSEU|nr:unnamed protein product [Cuscuta europaea]
MGWKYKAGLFLIAAVVVIWVTSAEVTQGIFVDYKQPFAVTYLGASLLVIYLPIAFLKDWICSYVNRRPTKSVKTSVNSDLSCTSVTSPLKYVGAKVFEIDVHGSLNRKDSDLNLAGDQEEGAPLIISSSMGVDATHAKKEKQITTRDIARYGFYIAPIWFVTEYLSNAALAYTSVASTTVLSATSGLFTLFFGVILGEDSLNMSKIVAVLISLAGVIMTTLGKTWATDESELNSSLVLTYR